MGWWVERTDIASGGEGKESEAFLVFLLVCAEGLCGCKITFLFA